MWRVLLVTKSYFFMKNELTSCFYHVDTSARTCSFSATLQYGDGWLPVHGKLRTNFEHLNFEQVEHLSILHI